MNKAQAFDTYLFSRLPTQPNTREFGHAGFIQSLTSLGARLVLELNCFGHRHAVLPTLHLDGLCEHGKAVGCMLLVCLWARTKYKGMLTDVQNSGMLF